MLTGRGILRRIAVVVFLLLLAIPPGSVAAAPVVETELSPSSQVRVVGSTATIRADVEIDGAAAPVDTVVQFFVTGANTTAGISSTNSQGVATFTYTGNNPGLDQVVASVNTVTSNVVTVEWLETEAANLTISPESLNAATGTAQSFTILVTDAAGEPVAGIEVRYRVTGVNPVAEAGGTTDDDGEVTFSYTGSNAGTDTVTAYVDLNGNGMQDAGETISDTATVVWSAPAEVTLAPATQTVDLADDATLTARVFDAQDRPLAGVTVNYSITGANPGSGTVTTGDNGSATITHGGTNVGRDTINAVVSGVNPPASATIQWYDGPAILDLSTADTTLALGATANVTASLEDSAGNPIPDVPIHFALTGTGDTSADDTTDDDGQATFSYSAPAMGVDTITVFADLNRNGTKDNDEPSDQLTITWTATAGLSLAPNSQEHEVGGSASLTATLVNPSGDSEDVPIRFNVTGANATSGSDETDDDGEATFSYTGNNAGTDTVTAYADLNDNQTKDVGEPSASATVTWSAPAPPPVFPPAQPANPKAGCTYFPQTHHNLCAGFQAYWNTFGGLAIYGMPITEEFAENGLTVQYFERARFEWHPGGWPERYDVMLGLLGNEVTQGRQSEPPFQRATAKSGACTYYAATGHNLCAGFRAYWEMYGGLAVYGFPISEEFREVNPDTGREYTVQYFERARFEWHPGEWPERYDVMLGRLGVQVLELRHGVEP